MGLYVQGGKKVGGMYMADGRGNATKVGGMYYGDGKGNATKIYSSYLPTGYVIFDGGGYATAFNNVYSKTGSSSPYSSVSTKIKIVKTNKIVLPFSINKLKTGIVISSSMAAYFSYNSSDFYSYPWAEYSSNFRFKSPISITKAELLTGYVYGTFPDSISVNKNRLSIKLVDNSLVFSSNAPIRYDAPDGTYGTAVNFTDGSIDFLLVDSITAY